MNDRESKLVPVVEELADKTHLISEYLAASPPNTARASAEMNQLLNAAMRLGIETMSSALATSGFGRQRIVQVGDAGLKVFNLAEALNGELRRHSGDAADLRQQAQRLRTAAQDLRSLCTE